MHPNKTLLSMIENPLVFGRAAEGPYFTDRNEDAQHLHANPTHGINTILISPRRWGKTCLVKKVIKDVDNNDMKTSTKLGKWVEMAKTLAAVIVLMTLTATTAWADDLQGLKGTLADPYQISSYAELKEKGFRLEF